MGKKKIRIGPIIALVFLSLIAVSTIYPILFMILSSFKTNLEYMTNVFGLPRQVNFGNYRLAFEDFDILRLASHSLLIAVSSVVITAVITSMAAYGFAKLRFRGSGHLLALVIACMMVPGQVLMIPVYLLMSRLHLINNFLSVILFYVSISIPFGTYMLTANCRNIPNEMIESAEIDGANPLLVFVYLILPMLQPAVMTLVILNFLTFWNELLYAMLFLQTDATRTMTVAIATIMGRYSTNMPLLMTGLLINCVPTLLIFIFFQKYLRKGIMIGSIK